MIHILKTGGYPIAISTDIRVILIGVNYFLDLPFIVDLVNTSRFLIGKKYDSKVNEVEILIS